MNLKQSIGLIAHQLFDWKAVFNPITRKLYPELYEYTGGVIKSFVFNNTLMTIHFTDFEAIYIYHARKGRYYEKNRENQMS